MYVANILMTDWIPSLNYIFIMVRHLLSRGFIAWKIHDAFCMLCIRCSFIWRRKLIVNADWNMVSNSERSCDLAFSFFTDWKNRSAFCCWRFSSPYILLSGRGGSRYRYPNLMRRKPETCCQIHLRTAWSRKPLSELTRPLTSTLGDGTNGQRWGVVGEAKVPFCSQGKGTDDDGCLAWLF